MKWKRIGRRGEHYEATVDREEQAPAVLIERFASHVIPESESVAWDAVRIDYLLEYGLVHMYPEQVGNPDRVVKVTCSVYMPEVEKRVYARGGEQPDADYDRFCEDIEKSFSRKLVQLVKTNSALDGRTLRFYVGGADEPYMTSEDF